MSPTGAQELPDSALYNTLDEIEVSGTRFQPLEKGGSMELSRERILGGVRAFGEADAIRYITTQPGVTTVSDYGSGVMIDGAATSHVLYRLDKVPVFFPFRFGGIFSAFNPTHFSKVDFERGFHNASMPSRLGAKFEFETPNTIPPTTSGNVNVGILSSSVSVIAPVRKVYVSLSARISYIDQIFGSLLQTSDFGAKYNFQDLNFTVRYNADSSNSFLLNFLGSNDVLKYDDSDYAMDTHLKWNNAVGSLSWIHRGRLNMSHRVYYSGFFSNLEFLMPQFGISSPSGLQTYGVAGDFDHIHAHPDIVVGAGYEFNGYYNKLQEVSVTGFGDMSDRAYERLRPFEARVYADGEFQLPLNLRLNLGLSFSYFRNTGGYNKFSVDPRLTLSIPAHPGTLNLHVGRYTQYLHQLGFSQIGLASDFWITSKKGIPAQTALSVEADYSGYLSSPGIYYSASIYWRRILHQPEYRGELLSIIDKDYDANDYISVESGFNLGGNILLRKEFGPVTGGLGIGYGIARRRQPGFEGYIRANSEPGFSLSVEGTWHINEKWDVGGNFRYNTGRPYTPMLAVYMVAANVVAEFGEPNSALLPAWHRLDLSATLRLHSGPASRRLTHLINFGIINAYGRKNIEFLTYKIDIEKGEFKLKRVSSLYRFLPTVSYTLEF